MSSGTIANPDAQVVKLFGLDRLATKPKTAPTQQKKTKKANEFSAKSQNHLLLVCKMLIFS